MGQVGEVNKGFVLSVLTETSSYTGRLTLMPKTSQ